MEEKNGKSHILLVEDEIALSKAMSEALRSDGYSVDTALDAERASASLNTRKPDLILLDIILPGKNGFELLREIKADARYSDVPVVILSNLGDEEEIKQGMSLGAVDYLVKADYDLMDLVRSVEKHLNHKANGRI